MIRLAKALFFCALILVARNSFAGSKSPQLYRWADEEGHIYYADKVPPQYSKYRRARLNEQGVTIDVVEESKSAKEIEREQRLQALRNAEQELLRDHLARDRSLLTTFKSEKEIDDTFKAKLSTIEILEKVALANLSRLETQLDAQEELAADFERKGRTVPQTVVDNIAGYHKQITRNQEKIRALGAQKLELRKKFAEDLDRFKSLTQPKREKSRDIGTDLNATAGNQDEESIILSVASCSDEEVCERTWDLARNYLLQHSTTPVRIDTDLIIYTAEPERDQDIALSLARIREKGSQRSQVFLDVRCKQSGIGRETCSGDRVRDILISFPPYIATGLKFVED